jgi:type I restriction enzyme R subunit
VQIARVLAGASQTSLIMSKHSIKNSEFLTRKRLIDERLKKSSWKVVRYKDDRSPSEYVAEVASRYGFCAIEEYPTQNGPADYALCVGGKVVGIVEAKKLTLGPQNALTQAERYSSFGAKQKQSASA